ncbi:KAP family P-loop NTPase fold protein [Asticcacaulis taihuensis]|uniref:KAP family P-loop domain-containing protein n=1 Tax=Asticcacaulis taihuensis TaxID=260084 RepID=A0A1G4QLL5_9CAUL|nr:P-loop NTPase fold protein [Asticcacaulis taihuensis]SCW45504.1 KAP family P-loop domain-containing protein [Asticcacaulis taihuensis]
MRIFPPQLVIGENDGFLPRYDIFERKKIGQGITNLLDSVSDPLVLALDAQWGSGKTTFLKMLAGHLRQADFPVIYFDAFENDYHEDAFLPIAGEIFSLIKSKTHSSEARSFQKKAVSAAKIVLRSALKVGIKAATAGILDGKEFENVAEDIGEELSTLEDKYIGEMITEQEAKKETVEEFKTSLSKISEIIRKSYGDKTQIKPLIFIIDELDRCRPDFALSVLERMKHFFQVDNVHFILGVHMGALQSSVKAAYGADIDAKIYLQKFISINISLVDNNDHEHTSTIKKFTTNLIENLELNNEEFEYFRKSKSYIDQIAEEKNLSLRTIEKIVTNIAICINYTGGTTFRPYPLIIGLCIFKALDSDLFVQAKTGKLKFLTVSQYFNFQKDANGTYEDAWTVNWWRYCMGEEMTEEELSDYRNVRFNYNFGERATILKVVANNVVDKIVNS